MKQFLQIHNTDCNKRRIFRRILLMKNALQSIQRHIEAHRLRAPKMRHLMREN